METCFSEKVFWDSIISKIKNPKVLEKLAKSPRIYVRIAVATNENTPIHCLNALSEDKDILVQCYVAKNKNIPIETLEKLARCENWQLRSWVADNKITPNYILEFFVDEMAKLKDVELQDKLVLLNVAKNPNTSVEVLEKLLLDDWDWVIGEALKNSKMPVEKLIEFSEHKSSEVRRLLAKNPNIPYEILLKLIKSTNDKSAINILSDVKLPIDMFKEFSESTDVAVRRQIASNSQAPTEILQKLASPTENSEVRSAALYTLKVRKYIERVRRKRNKN